MNATERWKAVCARDRTQDGRFFYGVGTTGISCRPVLPRTPAPAQERPLLRLHRPRPKATACAPAVAAGRSSWSATRGSSRGCASCARTSRPMPTSRSLSTHSRGAPR